MPQTGVFRYFFYNKAVSMYANLFLKISGFEQQINGIDKHLANKFINTFSKIIPVLTHVVNVNSKRQNNEELTDIISKVLNKLIDCIDQLEDIANPHYAYQISTSALENDWNNPLNDHWDNY